MMDDFATLLTRWRPAGLLVRLNSPQTGNALSAQMLADLHAALDLAERTPDCRIVVLEGGEDFCSGMDLTEPQVTDAASRSGQQYFSLLRRFTQSPLLVICAVRGRASGGGVGLVAAADFVVAAPAAVFSLPEALWGLLPCCVLPFLIRRVGFQKAYAMTLTTQPVGAEQGREFHLVDEVAERPEAVIGRLSLRARRVTAPTLLAAKRYFGALHPITAGTEALAVGELDRLLTLPQVRDAINAYATRHDVPWSQPLPQQTRHGAEAGGA